MTRFGELVEINPAAARSDKPYSFIAIGDIDVERGVAEVSRLTERGGGDLPFRAARPGDVIFARISPSLENGKVAIVPELETEEALVSPDLMVLRPRADVDPRLVWAFLRQDHVRSALAELTLGSSRRRRLRTESLESFELRLPHKQAWSTKARVLGHLDEARRLRRLFGERIGALPAAAASTVAAGAPLTSLRTGVEVRPGTADVSATSGYVRVLRAANVVKGRIDPGGMRFQADSEEAELLQEGDLLVVRNTSNPDRIGRCAVYEDERQPTAFASSLLMVRSTHFDPNFLWAWLRGSEAREEIARASWQQPTRHRLSLEAMADLPVPRVGKEEETWVAELARLARRLTAASERQIAVLERAVQAHLAETFGRARPLPADAEETRPAPSETLLPHVFAAASERQSQLWRKVSELTGGFGLVDLAREETEHAWVQHCLAIFEQLGLVVREAGDESYRWRHPDSELEVLR